MSDFYAIPSLNYPFFFQSFSMFFFCVCVSLSTGDLSMCVHASRFSHVQLYVTPWAVTHRASLYMGFSRQEYWSGLPWAPPGDLPDPGIEPTSFMSPALAGGFFATSATCEAL